MRAWLITWEGTDRRITDENRIVAIISGRKSSGYVEDVIDLLYLRATSSAYGMAYFANHKRQRRHENRAINNGGRIRYGSNPFLYGRKVSDLLVTHDTDRGLEIVRWVEPAYYQQNPDANFAIELVEPEKTKEIARPIQQPIGFELSA